MVLFCQPHSWLGAGAIPNGKSSLVPKGAVCIPGRSVAAGGLVELWMMSLG